MTLLARLSRPIAASPERVYDAWLEPSSLSAFLCPAPGVVTRVEALEARLGGAFSLVMVAGETEIPIHGRYTKMDRPRTLTFTWHSMRTTDESLVKLTFEADGEGTLLTLEHVGFTDAASRDDHQEGWGSIVELLSQSVRAPLE